MAADGYSYERVAIEQWLATGAGTSPKTNELLENEKLLPNKALKALIADARLPLTPGVINPNRGPGLVTRVITR